MGKCSWLAFEKGAKTVLTYVFSHVGLCAIVFAYSIAGSFLFSWLEQMDILVPYNASLNIEMCVDKMLSLSGKHGSEFSKDASTLRGGIMKTMLEHEEKVVRAVMDGRYDKTSEDLAERWSIINSLFFCVTVITTIGYGHISPRTTYGRMVTILYSLLGIPLMLLCLNNIGDSMASTFRFAYQKACCKAQKSEVNLPVLSDTNENSNSRRSFQPPEHYKPNRKTMTISPPISTTIHRGSDLPVTLPQSKSTANLNQSENSLPNKSKITPRTERFGSNSSSNLEYDANDILYECATYSGVHLPDMQISEPSTTKNRELTRSPVSRNQSPSSRINGTAVNQLSPFQLSKESLSANFSKEEPGEVFLSVPQSRGLACFSTHESSPSLSSTDQYPGVALESSGNDRLNQNGIDEIVYREQPNKRTAGKTLVVYNTLSGDALKQQIKIQKKLALTRSKQEQLKNDSTTVFTDPISGQAVHGDMLGLNYRPIEMEPPPEHTRVPVVIVLSFVFTYLVLGAVLFSSLESWRFSDSFYFCFITLSTIGFGDLVPGNLGYETREAQIKLVALALYVLMGLAVLAMSFSLLQEEVILKCKAFAYRIGLKEDDL